MTDMATGPHRTRPGPRSTGAGAGGTPGQAVPDTPLPESDVLVRTLVLELARQGALFHRTAATTSGTLLDVQVGEVRCVLTHLSPGGDGGQRPAAVEQGEDGASAPPGEDRCGAAPRLSPREIEIVRLVGAGHTNKTIAVVLDISLYTVSTHLRRIFAKLGVSTRAAMVAALSAELES